MEYTTEFNLEQEIGSAFEGIPQVESVYVIERGRNTVNVFTVVCEDDDIAYSKIYDQELALARKLPSLCFDFNVITRRGRPIQEFVGASTPAWERNTPWRVRQNT